MSTSPPAHARHWLQFSVRTLLVLLTLLGIWLGWHMHRRREQHRLVAAITAKGGTANPTGRLLFGIPTGQWALPNDIWLNNLNIVDSDLKPLESLPELVGLHIVDNHITDEGLAYLRGHTNLEVLDLTNNPAITDRGLAHLKNHTKLRQLMLRNNHQITDQGLAHLERMAHLDILILYGTSVTAAGAKRLQQKLPAARIGYRAAPAAPAAPAAAQPAAQPAQ